MPTHRRAHVALQNIQLTTRDVRLITWAPGDDRSVGQRRGNPEVGQVPHRPVLRPELLHTAEVRPSLNLPPGRHRLWCSASALCMFSESTCWWSWRRLPRSWPTLPWRRCSLRPAPIRTRRPSRRLRVLNCSLLLKKRKTKLSLMSQRRDSPSSARPRTSTCAAGSLPRASRHFTLTVTAEGRCSNTLSRALPIRWVSDALALARLSLTPIQTHLR